MRGRIILLVALLVMAAVEPEAANAQFSLRGVLGAVLHGGQFRRVPHHDAAQMNRRAARPIARGPSQLGLVGPLAWPSAFEDVLGYIFWPGEYGGNFRAHGFDVIYNTVIGRFALEMPAQTATNGAAVADTSSATGICDGSSGTQGDWPTARIEQSTQLTDTQRAALDQLRAAFADSIKTIRAGCRDITSLPPTDRLKAMVQQLWTVRDAGIFVRVPLKTFYDSLTDAQKASFEVKQPQDDPDHADKITNGGMSRQYQACTSQITDDAVRFIRQIEQTVRPTKIQRASLQALSKASSDMAKLLSASCAQPIPLHLLERLDAADNQLSSMNYAATNVEIALNGFYAKLDRHQQARLDGLGR